ncbi:unnamed protein product [Notodromas monacha]|uniref:Complex 1 LYR protein domain-containing protein n=1 Tax=Notodromas monacha TaxID=399045 RepID=A0A7R9GE00_9CRUS|nr:unnamed protein product [Notodromas monacha]CAG0919238.1 unnamed protein product [Notodromas monacha]
MDLKYANLPGIAHGEPDVYESSDLPESEQSQLIQQVDTSAAVDVIPVDVEQSLKKFKGCWLDPEFSDFSDRILPRGHRGYDQRHGEWVLADEGSENLVQKYQRLKRESEELLEDLKRCKELKPGADDLPAKLLPSASDLFDELSCLKLENALGAECVATLGDANSISKKKLTAAVDSLRDAKSTKDASGKEIAGQDSLKYEIVHLPGRENYENMKSLCTIDERLSALEKVIGNQQASSMNVLNSDVFGVPLISAVKTLASKINLLDASKMDMMEARASSLLNKVHEISDRAAAGAQERDTAKLNELHSLMKSTEAMRGMMPDLVDRLVALKDIHEQAGDVLRLVTEMDEVQKKLLMQIREEHERLDVLDASVKQSVSVMMGNVVSRAMAYLQTRVITHPQRVCSLYKKLLRNLEATYRERIEYRVQAVLLRAEFDKHKDEKDYIVAKQLLERGEKHQFETQHYQAKCFANSPGGAAYDREVNPPDWLMDYWHPLEKAMFPDYFAKREARKKEYIEFYEKTYGKNSDMKH